MKTIRLNVEGLPEPFVEAVKTMVKALREHFQAQATGGELTPVKLPVWPGKVIGPLTREEIYSDRLDRAGFPRRGSERSKP